MSDEPRDRSDRELELEKLVGRTIAGRYKVTKLIGLGGMGAVYEGEHLGIGKKVALKFVDREFAQTEQVASRFAREARAASAIESDHIVQVFDAGMDEDRPYIVMELLRGEDLGRMLRRTNTIPIAEALSIVAQVLRGLADAHEAGIVHRDLKPDNVFLTERRSEAFVKIVDFGISKIERTSSGTTPLALTQKGTVLGTPLYMSPEQAQAAPDLDGRTDLYSVGAILFESIAGRPPHVGETYEQIIVSICMTDAPDLRKFDPEVPEAVARFVRRALSRDRAKRFSSARQMLVALAEILPTAKALISPDSVKRTSESRSAITIPGWRNFLWSRTALVGTAIFATLAGGLATMWVVSMTTHRVADLPRPELPPRTSTTITVASTLAPVPSAPPSARTPSATVSATPVKSTHAASVKTAPAAPPVTPVTPGPGKPKAGSDGLDLQRDFPQ
jgi:serine/threonine protein kinase